MKINKKNLKKAITKSLVREAINDYLLQEIHPCQSLHLIVTEDNEVKLAFSSLRNVIFRPENMKYQIELMSDSDTSNLTLITFFSKNVTAIEMAIDKLNI